MITPEQLELRLTRVLKSRLARRYGAKPRWDVSCQSSGNDILVAFGVVGHEVFTRVYGSTHALSGIVGDLMSWWESQVDQIVTNRISKILWDITDR